MVAMQSPLQAELAAYFSPPAIAGRIVGRAVETGRNASIPDDELIRALVAAAGTLARQQSDAEKWQALLPRAAVIAMEGPTDGH